MKILISNSAVDDLEKMKEYYQEQGVPHVGEDFVVKIFQRIDSLAVNPDIGRIVPEFNSKKIRELIHSPFRIIYVREVKTIHIVRIWRSERLLRLPSII